MNLAHTPPSFPPPAWCGGQGELGTPQAQAGRGWSRLPGHWAMAGNGGQRWAMAGNGGQRRSSGRRASPRAERRSWWLGVRRQTATPKESRRYWAKAVYFYPFFPKTDAERRPPVSQPASPSLRRPPASQPLPQGDRISSGPGTAAAGLVSAVRNRPFAHG